MIELKSSIFTTLTYDRTQDSEKSWDSVATDANRFVQRLRRQVGSVEYLRGLERHKSGYPHIHWLLLFRTPFRCSRGKDSKGKERYYIEHTTYAALQKCWSNSGKTRLGHDDWVVPLNNNSGPVINYVVKYITKTSSNTNLWKLLLAERAKPATDNKAQRISRVHLPSHTIVNGKKVKLLSWSRGFVALARKRLDYNLRRDSETINVHTTP